jgi:hypothetical protein
VRIRGLTLILFLSLGLFYCSSEGEQKAVVANKVVLVLFDLSESTNKPEIRKTYSENFGVILSKITHGDAVVAGWITEHSGAELVLPVNISFPPFESATTNPLVRRGQQAKEDSKLRETLRGIHEELDSLLQHTTRKVLQTDILSSLLMAERIFKNFPHPKKVLVIMSDMIEDSGTYNFERETLTSERISQIIIRAKKDGRLPDLAGVKVYVIGATARDMNKFYQIRNFWLTYFQACQANLIDYGSALVRFEP